MPFYIQIGGEEVEPINAIFSAGWDEGGAVQAKLYNSKAAAVAVMRDYLRFGPNFPACVRTAVPYTDLLGTQFQPGAVVISAQTALQLIGGVPIQYVPNFLLFTYGFGPHPVTPEAMQRFFRLRSPEDAQGAEEVARTAAEAEAAAARTAAAAAAARQQRYQNTATTARSVELHGKSF